MTDEQIRARTIDRMLADIDQLLCDRMKADPHGTLDKALETARNVRALLKQPKQENARLRTVLKQTAAALSKAEDHLDWTGWGDSYERSCAYDDKLPELIGAARIAAAEALK